MDEGKAVTFSGIDGSGKSILADRTYKYICTKGIDAIRLEVYSRSIFLNIGRLVGRMSKKTKVNVESALGSRNKKMNISFGWLRRLCLRLDIAIFKLTMCIIRIKGLKPVCDRYLYDTLIHLRYLKVVSDRQYSLFLKKIPRPDLPILLFLNADTAKDREGQHEGIEYYREKIQLYEQLAQEENLLNIDSSYDLETVWKSVKDVIDSKLKIK